MLLYLTLFDLKIYTLQTFSLFILGFCSSACGWVWYLPCEMYMQTPPLAQPCMPTPPSLLPLFYPLTVSWNRDLEKPQWWVHYRPSVHLENSKTPSNIICPLLHAFSEANGDYKKVWENHCNDKETLEEYASAMRMLAINHWMKQAPEGRVEWCYKAATEFFKGEGLKKLMEKHRRKREFCEDVNECCCCFITGKTNICSATV